MWSVVVGTAWPVVCFDWLDLILHSGGGWLYWLVGYFGGMVMGLKGSILRVFVADWWKRIQGILVNRHMRWWWVDLGSRYYNFLMINWLFLVYCYVIGAHRILILSYINRLIDPWLPHLPILIIFIIPRSSRRSNNIFLPRSRYLILPRSRYLILPWRPNSQSMTLWALRQFKFPIIIFSLACLFDQRWLFGCLFFLEDQKPKHFRKHLSLYSTTYFTHTLRISFKCNYHHIIEPSQLWSMLGLCLQITVSDTLVFLFYTLKPYSKQLSAFTIEVVFPMSA